MDLWFSGSLAMTLPSVSTARSASPYHFRQSKRTNPTAAQLKVQASQIQKVMIMALEFVFIVTSS
jgi:hypothetical protein